jgi:hypothetical protein
MFTRIDEKKRETKSQEARLTNALSRTERGKLPSQTQPNPNNQSLKVVNIEKFEEVKSVTILRSGKEIGRMLLMQMKNPRRFQLKRMKVR